jgi:hypothetical protein
VHTESEKETHLSGDALLQNADALRDRFQLVFVQKRMVRRNLIRIDRAVICTTTTIDTTRREPLSVSHHASRDGRPQ